MEYELTVHARTPNPEYETAKNNRFGDMPQPYLQDRMLTVVLTEDEYEEVKKAVIAVFE